MNPPHSSRTEYVQLDFWHEPDQSVPDSANRKPTADSITILTPEEQAAIEERLAALTASRFRQSFHLRKKDYQYIQDKGMPIIVQHALDLIHSRLAPAHIPNDGKQTPMRGHPVFLAQHATGTCCRSCLKKWHHIEPGMMLTEKQQKYIVALIMAWIQKQVSALTA